MTMTQIESVIELTDNVQLVKVNYWPQCMSCGELFDGVNVWSIEADGLAVCPNCANMCRDDIRHWQMYCDAMNLIEKALENCPDDRSFNAMQHSLLSWAQQRDDEYWSMVSERVLDDAEAHTEMVMNAPIDERIKAAEEARQKLLKRSQERLEDLAEAGQARWDDKREVYVIDGGEKR